MTKRKRPRKTLAAESDPRDRALEALALARRGYSLRRAAGIARTDPRTVRRHVGTAFRKEGRRWAPTRFDRIAREMTVLTREGPVVVVVRDSRTASLLAAHANAVRAYIETGDEERLRRLRRRRIRVGGEEIALVTDPVVLDRLAAGSELHYELYRR